MFPALHPTRARTLAAIALMAGLAWGGVNWLSPQTEPRHNVQASQQLVDGARASQTIQPDAHAVALPLSKTQDATQRKTLFIAAMLPLIVRENERLAGLRARAKAAQLGNPLGSPQFSALAYAYGLPPHTARQTLLRRIDTLPVSLVLAQAALESAWGKSRFARDANAYFGERTYNPDLPGLAPKAAAKGQAPFKVRSFPLAYLSVRSFMHNLNTHPAYDALRRRRAQLRAHDQPSTGLALAPFLHGYSEIGDVYVQRVIATIRSNRLSAFDGLKLAAERH